MKKTTGTFPSATGLCRIHFYIYAPEKPKAVLMLSHGMCEYIERYEDFARFLCENDIALCANDHVGHGRSLSDDGMLGYFGEAGGYIAMTHDLHRMKLLCERVFPDIPHFLLGHSMGSFLARIYLARYADRWDGAVLMGTAGGLATAAPLRKVIDRIIKARGSMCRYRLGTRLAFGVFNLRNENHRTSYDWLSRNDDNVNRFIADPKCNFIFTAAGYRDLINALLCCNSEAVFDNTPRDLPMLFLSGGMDPVGEYGRGVERAAERYAEHGCSVRMKIYREARHELLFELNRQEVMEDILGFLMEKI